MPDKTYGQSCRYKTQGMINRGFLDVLSCALFHYTLNNVSVEFIFKGFDYPARSLKTEMKRSTACWALRNTAVG